MLRHFKGVFRTLRLWSRVWWWCRSEHLGSSPTSPPLSSSSGRALSELFTGAIFWMIGQLKNPKIPESLHWTFWLCGEKHLSCIKFSWKERRENIGDSKSLFPISLLVQRAAVPHFLWGPFWFVGSFLGLDLTKTCTQPPPTHTAPIEPFKTRISGCYCCLHWRTLCMW